MILDHRRRGKAVKLLRTATRLSSKTQGCAAHPGLEKRCDGERRRGSTTDEPRWGSCFVHGFRPRVRCATLGSGLEPRCGSKKAQKATQAQYRGNSIQPRDDLINVVNTTAPGAAADLLELGPQPRLGR